MESISTTWRIKSNCVVWKGLNFIARALRSGDTLQKIFNGSFCCIRTQVVVNIQRELDLGDLNINILLNNFDSTINR